MSIQSTQTVRELAIRIPGATRIFEDFHIDYSCRGARTLEDACKADGVEIDQIAPRLERAAARMDALAESGWEFRPIRDLARHILERHHTYTRDALDRLGPLVEKVARVHGEKHPELAEIRTWFREIEDDLRPHLIREEVILFPYIETLDAASRAGRPHAVPPFGSVENPVRMMLMEHDHAGDILRKIRDATSGYVAPPDACSSYEALYRGLEALERDLHEHMHLETNLLFPRAIELEEESG
jgi:regulator of cell morphogenesis and NO signaling